MKNNMRRTLIQLATLIAFAMIPACTNLQEEEIIPTSLATDTRELMFSEVSGTKSLVIVSGTRWNVSGTPSWLSVQSINSRRSSYYEWTVTLAAETNDGYDREGLLYIKAGSELITINVEQKGKKGKYVAVESISILPTELSLTEGESASLSYTITPSNASEKEVTWQSSSSSIALVYSGGSVKAVSVGECRIDVITKDGQKRASCIVTVKPKQLYVTHIVFDKHALTLNVGEDATFKTTIYPANATDKQLVWKSTDDSIVSVDNSGRVTALKAGTATVYASPADGGGITLGTSIVIDGAGYLYLDGFHSGLNVERYDIPIIAKGENGMIWFDGVDTNYAVDRDPAVVTIGTNGHWVINGRDTGLDCIGHQGPNKPYCVVTVQSSTNPVPEAVDLGLSVKWASSNLGASLPEEYGDYYAWGDPNPYYSSFDPLIWENGKESGYVWTSYKWCNGSENTLTKYCTDSSYGYNGFTDYKTRLDPEDDAAHVHLGDKWRLPTFEELEELRDKCTTEWTTKNGVIGRLVTGPNGNSIFFPTSGGFFGQTHKYAGDSGYYWSSSLNIDPSVRVGSPTMYAYTYMVSNSISSEYHLTSYNRGHVGGSIRPVYEK